MTMYCSCLDVRGAIKRITKRNLARMFKRADGTRLSAAEAKDYLLDQLAQGREFIPFGQCDNFDYKNGCMGHPEKERSDG
ncbi:hypothetical protein [Dyella sp.]|uniref:hypothetical protein n=1 Tax=Dyella sp. TaxID=1869338 RepID=UPI002FD92976